MNKKRKELIENLNDYNTRRRKLVSSACNMIATAYNASSRGEPLQGRFNLISLYNKIQGLSAQADEIIQEVINELGDAQGIDIENTEMIHPQLEYEDPLSGVDNEPRLDSDLMMVSIYALLLKINEELERRDYELSTQPIQRDSKRD